MKIQFSFPTFDSVFVTEVCRPCFWFIGFVPWKTVLFWAGSTPVVSLLMTFSKVRSTLKKLCIMIMLIYWNRFDLASAHFPKVWITWYNMDNIYFWLCIVLIYIYICIIDTPIFTFLQLLYTWLVHCTYYFKYHNFFV